MIGLIVMSPTLVAFLVASLILAVTPGPGVVYIVTQTLGQGRKAGLSSVGGIISGTPRLFFAAVRDSRNVHGLGAYAAFASPELCDKTSAED
jgi:hypothetical protein